MTHSDITFGALAVATALFVGLVIVPSCRHDHAVARECVALGYRTSRPVLELCETRINGTDILIPLEEARKRPRPWETR